MSCAVALSTLKKSKKKKKSYFQHCMEGAGMGCDSALLLLLRAESSGDRALCMQADTMRAHICKAAY